MRGEGGNGAWAGGASGPSESWGGGVDIKRRNEFGV